MIFEARLKARLEKLGCTADTFCLIAEISPTRWGRAMRDISPLTGPECEVLSGLIDQMEGLAHDALPYQISFRDAQLIRYLLEQRKNGVRLIPVPHNFTTEVEKD